MPYSFHVQAATKAAALTAVRDTLPEGVSPEHLGPLTAAVTASADAIVGAMADREDADIQVDVRAMIAVGKEAPHATTMHQLTVTASHVLRS